MTPPPPAAEPTAPRLAAESGGVTAVWELPAARMELSQTQTLTLTVEGRAPLQVTLPPRPLTPATLPLWKLQPQGAPLRTALPDGRERWEQRYRLEPYLAGEKVPLQWEAIAARDGGSPLERQLAMPAALQIHVGTQVSEAKQELLRPVSGIERIPPAGAVPGPPWWVALPPLLVAALLLWRWRRRRRRVTPAPVPGSPAALRAGLGALGDESMGIAAWCGRWVELVRSHLQWRTGRAVQGSTVPELLQQFAEVVPPPLQTALRAAESIRFAPGGDGESSCNRQDWIAWLREWAESGEGQANHAE